MNLEFGMEINKSKDLFCDYSSIKSFKIISILQSQTIKSYNDMKVFVVVPMEIKHERLKYCPL